MMTYELAMFDPKSQTTGSNYYQQPKLSPKSLKIANNPYQKINMNANRKEKNFDKSKQTRNGIYGLIPLGKTIAKAQQDLEHFHKHGIDPAIENLVHPILNNRNLFVREDYPVTKIKNNPFDSKNIERKRSGGGSDKHRSRSNSDKGTKEDKNSDKGNRG